MFSELSDHELVDSYQNVADPMAVEMLKAEERRRVSDKALVQATRSNKIAIASLVKTLKPYRLLLMYPMLYVKLYVKQNLKRV